LKPEPNKEVHPLARSWELAEAKRRREDPQFADAQERAEMAIMNGKDYDDDSPKQKR
jgi:hypothetical protein